MHTYSIIQLYTQLNNKKHTHKFIYTIHDYIYTYILYTYIHIHSCKSLLYIYNPCTPVARPWLRTSGREAQGAVFEADGGLGQCHCHAGGYDLEGSVGTGSKRGWRRRIHRKSIGTDGKWRKTIGNMGILWDLFLIYDRFMDD